MSRFVRPSTRRRFPLIAAIVLCACWGPLNVEPWFVNPTGGRPVLFIGNSLTYENVLPLIVQGLADAAGGDSLAVGMSATGDAALIDRWNRGDARAEIDRRRWDFVVLQQGPSSVEANRDTLRLAAKLFAPAIANAGAKAVLFSTWPTIDRRQDFPRAAESYRLAAQDVGGLYAPVAAAWLLALQRDPTLQLYASDGLHPSPLGSYLSALVLYSTILDKSPVGLPAYINFRGGGGTSAPPAVAQLLQEVAWKAVVASKS